MGFDPGFECPACLATLKSSDRTKQSVCGWLYIYIYKEKKQTKQTMPTSNSGKYTQPSQNTRQHPTRHQLYGHLPPITKKSKLDEPDMQGTTGEAGTSS